MESAVLSVLLLLKTQVSFGKNKSGYLTLVEKQEMLRRDASHLTALKKKGAWR